MASLDIQMVGIYAVFLLLLAFVGRLVKRYLDRRALNKGVVFGRNAPGLQTNVRKAWVPVSQVPGYVGLQGRGVVEEIDLRPNASTSSTPSRSQTATPTKAIDDEWLPTSAANKRSTAQRKPSGKSKR